MNSIIKLLHIIQWIIVITITIPLMVLGAFVVIPLALLFKADMRTLPIWGNREEGYPAWFDKYVQDYWYKKIFPRWWWFSIRNSLNNVRFLFDDSKPFKVEGWQKPSMEAHDLIAANVRSASRWSYRGITAGWRRVWLTTVETDIKFFWYILVPAGEYYSELWFGWKVGSTVEGLDITSQVRLYVEIGK